jgi:DNA replication protein DnaC
MIAEHVRSTTSLRPSPAELRSWDHSLPALANDLLDAGLGEVEMLIEYQLPLTSKRADVVLAGVDRRTGEDAYLVVELKQWSRAEVHEDNPEIALVDGVRGDGLRLNPLSQVAAYCDYLTDFVTTLEHCPDAVRGVAYLHNAADRDVADLRGSASHPRIPLFSRTRRAEFLDYLRAQFAQESGAHVADRLLSSSVRPSKQLMALAAEEIKHREQFVLLDEQKLAFELVRTAVEKARRADSKEVIVITGGPGSGKSAIALSLLGELYRQNRHALHATGSRSFTTTMRNHVGRGSTRVKDLFKYFNSFMRAERNDLDVLICDEAHRIRESSSNRFTRAELRTGRPQVDELMAAARVPVFLLDEHQVVRPGEIGTVAAIRGHADRLQIPVRQVDLDAQFRCGGSRKYERWVHDLLGLEGAEPEAWTGDERFEIHLAETPSELEQALRAKLDIGFGARMTAGYCWPWSDPRRDETLVPDVKIGGWERPWNVKNDRSVGSAPPSALWSTADGGFEQIGCVYTAQGFEYDWNGVIIGPDLVARGGRLVTQRWESRDPDLRKKAVTDFEADRLIRNTYKVLLTRGMIGTHIFAVDEETQAFLRSLLNPRG